MKKHSIYGYQGPEMKTFLKIIAESRSKLLRAKNILFYSSDSQIYMLDLVNAIIYWAK